MRTRRLQREIIPVAGVRRNRWLRQARYAVLIIGWMQAMPMNCRRHREFIFEQDVKRLIDRQGRQPLLPPVCSSPMRVAVLSLISSVRIVARSLVASDNGGSSPAGNEAPPRWLSNAAPAQAAPEEIKERRDMKRATSPPHFLFRKSEYRLH